MKTKKYRWNSAKLMKNIIMLVGSLTVYYWLILLANEFLKVCGY